jgi:hypothetical protein
VVLVFPPSKRPWFGSLVQATIEGMTITFITGANNGHSGSQTVTEGTDAIVALATEGPGAGTGRFIDRHGEIAWS